MSNLNAPPFVVEGKLTSAALDEFAELRPQAWTGTEAEQFLQSTHAALHVLMVAVVLVLLGTGEFLDFWRGETLHWVSWGLSVVAMLLLVARALWLYVPVWIARRRAMSSLARYILTGEGILIEGVGGQSKMVPWRQFRGFYTSTRLIVCFPSGAGDPVLIPAQDLSDSRRRDVESLVRSKLPEFLTRVECTRLD